MKKMLCLFVLLLTISSFTVLAEEVQCTDSDGGVNPFWKGALSDKKSISGSLKQDTCFDRFTVLEYSCEKPEGEKIGCEFGCSEGTCKESGSRDLSSSNCYDTDPANDPSIVGSVAHRDINTVSRDYCFDSFTLFDQSCDGGEKISCPLGCNPKGYCEQRGSVASPQETCIDSDGGKDYFTQGAVSHPNQVVESVQRDFCIEENVLIEQTCEGTFRVECPKGCSHGVCSGDKTANVEGVLVEDSKLTKGIDLTNSNDVEESESEEDVQVEVKPDTNVSDEEETKSKTWLWVLIVVIVIAIIYFATGKDEDEKKKED